ncbi:MFS general substrate transporter [Zopfia rhizophila CBS 207.26]|uniref:MFS general substrate transporter n=1 Tax=Zopfia rhizophila CBS 207.26 TaxID=1314779 RepID=A0A6A6EBX4_9PEZI|nr:MFS general substrate transporter [Zopfia rhizophila CBS 207.26]
MSSPACAASPASDLQQQQPLHSDEPEQLAPLKQWNLTIITLSLALGTFLVALDTMIVGIAVPTITSQFHSLDDIAWYGSAYLLTCTALQPSFGRIYELYSSKTAYLTCVGIFEVGSIICAAPLNSTSFIIGRAIAGCGAAGLVQGALNIITNTVPLAKQPLYMGIVISVFGISVCVGPVLGGAFTQDVSWRWCFWINVPIGAAAFFLILIFLKLKKQKQRTQVPIMKQVWQLDPLGAGLLISGVVCPLLALQWGGISKPWRSATVISLFIGAGLLLILFCVTQWKMGEDATIPLHVLQQRSISFGSLFLFFIANSGYIVPYMILGTAVSIVGSALLATLNAYTPTIKWAVYMVIAGIGTGISVNLPYTALQVVLKEDVPTGNAIAQFTYQLGAAISLSIGQTVFPNKIIREVATKKPASRP